MKAFLVWYVLSVTTISDGKLASGLWITNDLQECQHLAARKVAEDPNSRWRCHEMTTEIKDKELYVAFPDN